MMARPILAHRRRVDLLRIRAEMAFLGLARYSEDQDRDESGRFAGGGGGGGSSSSSGSYTATYGEVLDEENVSLGGGDAVTVAVTETGDMHIAFDPGGGSLDDRDVLTELTPDSAQELSGELRAAAEYEPTGNEVPNEEGIIASAQVQGLDDIEVWVHETGDVGIRDVNQEGMPGIDMSSDQALGLADALVNMADFYNQEFD